MANACPSPIIMKRNIWWAIPSVFWLPTMFVTLPPTSGIFRSITLLDWTWMSIFEWCDPTISLPGLLLLPKKVYISCWHMVVLVLRAQVSSTIHLLRVIHRKQSLSVILKDVIEYIPASTQSFDVSQMIFIWIHDSINYGLLAKFPSRCHKLCSHIWCYLIWLDRPTLIAHKPLCPPEVIAENPLPEV